MIFLTDSAIKYAANICSEIGRYKVVVACAKCRRDYYFRLLMSVLDNCDVSKICDNHLYFNNGSEIKFIRVSESARGAKADLIIADMELDDEFIHNILLPMEIHGRHGRKRC